MSPTSSEPDQHEKSLKEDAPATYISGPPTSPASAKPDVQQSTDFWNKSHDIESSQQKWKIIMAFIAILELCSFWPSLMSSMQFDSSNEEVLSGGEGNRTSLLAKTESLLLSSSTTGFVHLPASSDSDDSKALENADTEISYTWQESVDIFFVTILCLRALFRTAQRAKAAVSTKRGNFRHTIKKALFFFCLYLLILFFYLSLIPFFDSGVVDKITTTNNDADSNQYASSSSEHQRSFIWEGISRPMSLLDLFVIQFLTWLQLTTSSFAKSQGKAIAKKLGKFAIRNPLTIRKDVKKALTVLRWVKFLAPVIGTLNKFKGNVNDLLKKWKQKLRAEKARRAWKKSVSAMTTEQRMKAVAIRIQSNFRMRKKRREMEAAISLQSKVEKDTVLKIQRAFRARREIRRLSIENKERILKELEEHRRKRTMTREEYELMVKYQKDVDSFRLSEQALLLRPDTKFAVTWKFMAVTCIMLEILQLLFSRMVLGESKKVKLEDLVKDIMLPCENVETLKVHPLKKIFLSPAFKIKHRVDAENMENMCPAVSSFWKSIWITFVNFFATKFVYVVETVCFLDVPITFLTGELNPKNGVLMPKPFFSRWILPGLALQLLVNPAMINVADFVKKMVKAGFDVGLTRFFHVVLGIMPIFWFVLDHTFDTVSLALKKASTRGA
eukprot:CAMPEP_0195521474 /NCGR_PEP_ID=MMETSP0794_2-20130614/18762_1 /TAXON_ID=515487 /ORGANISM="Stephanopyxis turris, Strain CCMP 815" /LENGTH=669 /DNA_ID=CAMNT_0040651043 /DNA_START=226 /DNA_END=2235 /DNA_ORIENTATION=+